MPAPVSRTTDEASPLHARIEWKILPVQHPGDGRYRHDEQILGRILWMENNGRTQFAADWSENGKGNITTAPRL